MQGRPLHHEEHFLEQVRERYRDDFLFRVNLPLDSN